MIFSKAFWNEVFLFNIKIFLEKIISKKKTVNFVYDIFRDSQLSKEQFLKFTLFTLTKIHIHIDFDRGQWW